MNAFFSRESVVETHSHASGPRVSARAVIVDAEARILLVRHVVGDRIFHVLPGGRMEAGETAAEAACREVHEETGLQVVIGELLWVREFLPQRHEGHPYHNTQVQQLQLYFRAEMTSDAISRATSPDSTQSEVIWLPLASVSEVVLLPVGLAGSLQTMGSEKEAASGIYLGDLP